MLRHWGLTSLALSALVTLSGCDQGAKPIDSSPQCKSTETLDSKTKKCIPKNLSSSPDGGASGRFPTGNNPDNPSGGFPTGGASPSPTYPSGGPAGTGLPPNPTR